MVNRCLTMANIVFSNQYGPWIDGMLNCLEEVITLREETAEGTQLCYLKQEAVISPSLVVISTILNHDYAKAKRGRRHAGWCHTVPAPVRAERTSAGAPHHPLWREFVHVRLTSFGKYFNVAINCPKSCTCITCACLTVSSELASTASSLALVPSEPGRTTRQYVALWKHQEFNCSHSSCRTSTTFR